MRIRIDKYPVLLLSLLALLFSCEKEPSAPEPEESVRIYYSAVVSEDSETRATLNGSGHYVFEAGDQLYVENTDDGNAGKVYGLLTLVSGAGETSAVFEGDLSCVDGYIPVSDTQLAATLIGANEHSIHSFTNGKLNAARSYPNEYATDIADAISKFSDFTASNTYGAHSFTLAQQSAFLVFTVKFLKTDVASGTGVTASVKNDINNTNITLRSGSVSATTLGADHTQVNFVAAFPGGTTSLSGAALSVTWGSNPERVLGLSDATLAANNYYTVTRSTFRYSGFRIRPATNETTTVTFKYNYSNSGIEYSTDEGVTWTQYSSGAITLPNDGICVKGTRVNYQNVSGTIPGDNPLFTATNKVYIAGNIMTLLADEVNLSDSAFQGTFSKKNTDINYIDINPSDPLILPNMTLAANCYSQMFMRCTGLTSIPDNLLPATDLSSAASCYSQMFKGCTSLTTLPATLLPATTLEELCYSEMFSGCTGLTSLPATLLPATNLAASCYSQMFQNCSGLSTLPEELLPATTLADQCYNQMFQECSGLTTLPERLLPATILAELCYNQMFQNCSGLTTLPGGLLPAGTMKFACYRHMFYNCDGLTSIPSNLLPAMTLATACYALMFYDCDSMDPAPDLPAITPQPACYFNIFRSSGSLMHVKCMLYLEPSQQVTTNLQYSTAADPTISELRNFTECNIWSVFNKWVTDTKNTKDNEGNLFHNNNMPSSVFTKNDGIGKVPGNWKLVGTTP